MVANPSRPKLKRSAARLRRAWILVGSCCLGFLAGFGAPVEAEILVMRDGTRVLTDGPWEIEGRQVLFTMRNGTLSAVRLSEVDLEASEIANQQAADAASTAEPAADETSQVEDALVLTNKSLGHGPDGVIELEGSESQTGVKPDGAVQVVDWEYRIGSDGAVYEVFGTLANEGAFEAHDISLHLDIVAVDPASGRREDSRHILRRARVARSMLAPGTNTTFRYGVSESDLGVHGARGFDDPIVSFDVQFRKVLLPQAEGDEGDGDPPPASGDEAETEEGR